MACGRSSYGLGCPLPARVDSPKGPGKWPCSGEDWGELLSRVAAQWGHHAGGWAWESFIPRSLFCKLVCNFYLLEKDCVAGG